MLIYDCSDFEVIFRPGNSNFVLVTFSSLGMFNAAGSLANGKLFWGESLADRFDYTAVGFMAKKRDWFCSPEMAEACRVVVREISGSIPTLLYGSSMGGYAALRWANALQASSVVAFAPQFSIEPDVVRSFDRRYEYAYRPDIHEEMGIREEHVSCPSFLLYDPLCTDDLEHVNLILHHAPATSGVALRHCGHECIRIMSNSSIADQLLSFCVKPDEDALRSFVEKARKSSSIRVFGLTQALINSKPALARRILTKYGNSFERNQRATLEDRLSFADSASTTQSDGNSVDTHLGSTMHPPSSNSMRTDMQEQSPVSNQITRRVIHMHVPKTAGTALRSAFTERFKGQLRIFPEWDENKYVGIDENDYDFFSGHFGFETAKRLRGDVITVLRHPIDRFISVYYFWRSLYAAGTERSANTELAARFELRDFVRLWDQPGLVEEFYNRCTFQVVYGSSLGQRRQLRLQGRTDDDIFKMAVENLRSCKVVGIQENLGGFVNKIARTFAVKLDVRSVNVTKDRPDMDSVSVDVRKVIQDWVYMDIELYQEALKIVD